MPSKRFCDDDAVPLEGGLEQMITEDGIEPEAPLEPTHLFHELVTMLDRAIQLFGLSGPAEPEWQGTLMDSLF